MTICRLLHIAATRSISFQPVYLTREYEYSPNILFDDGKSVCRKVSNKQDPQRSEITAYQTNSDARLITLTASWWIRCSNG